MSLSTNYNFGVNATSITVNNINVTGSIYQNNVISNQFTTTSGNLSYTSGNLIIGNNISSSNLQSINSTLSNLITSNMNSTNITATNLYNSLISTSNIQLSGNITVGGNLIVGGTLTSVNITSVNLVDTNITAGSIFSTNLNSSRIDIGGSQPNINNSTIGKLFITGTQNSTSNGPNIIINTSQDIYPTYNYLTYGHDTQWMMYDMYYDGTTFRNSHTTPGFMQVKENSSLRWYYTTASSAGATAVSTIGMTYGSNGNLGLGGQTNPGFTLDVTGLARITSNVYVGGNVGIGTTSPSTKLHLRDTGSVTLLLEADSDNVNETDVPTIQLRQDNGLSGTDLGMDSLNTFYIDYNKGTSVLGNAFSINDNNVSRLYINSSGNLGINTTSPGTLLQVDGEITFNVMPGIGTTGSIKIGREDNYNARWHTISSNVGTSASLNTMIFNLHNASSATSTVPVVTLRGDGNVGIGITSPNVMLDISSSNTGTVNLLNVTSNLSTNSTLQRYLYAGKSDFSSFNGIFQYFVYNSNSSINNAVRWDFNGNNNVFYLTGVGNLGLGNSDPTVNLVIGSGISGNTFGSVSIQKSDARYKLYNNAGVAEWILGQKSTTRSDFTISKIVNTTETDYFTITTGGNVGIGTTSPIRPLQVNAAIRIAGSGAVLDLGDDFTTQIYRNVAISEMRFGTNSVARMTITSSGNIGINTTSPISLLDVNGSARISNTSATSVGTLIVSGPGNSTYSPATTTQGQLASFYGPGGAGVISNFDLSTYIPNSTQLFLPSVRFSMLDGGNGNSTFNILTRNAGNGTGTMASRIMIDGSGNVGINTTSPAYKLEINGNCKVTNELWVGNANTVGTIYLGGGAAGDADYNFSVIESRLYSSTENSELILFKGNDIAGAAGPDRIRLRAAAIALDTYPSVSGDRTAENIRMYISETGNVGIGTTSPVNALDVSGFARIGSGNSSFLLNLGSSGVGGSRSAYLYGDGTTASLVNQQAGSLFLATNNLSASISIVTSGNVGISTLSPAYTLDVNGTIARSGVRLPRFDNGTFSGASVAVIPVLFSDATYNYVEIKVRYIVSSANCNVVLNGNTASNGGGTNTGLTEHAETTVRFNAQSSPTYTNSGLISQTTEASGIDNQFTIRIVRASGTSVSGLRNHYSFDTTYCWAGVGTARVYGQGHMDTALNLSTQLLSILMTPSAGTISGTWSTQHSY